MPISFIKWDQQESYAIDLFSIELLTRLSHDTILRLILKCGWKIAECWSEEMNSFRQALVVDSMGEGSDLRILFRKWIENSGGRIYLVDRFTNIYADVNQLLPLDNE